MKHWLRWSARHKWVSRSLARDEWIARTSDDQIVSNVTACKLALTTRALDFLTANDGPNFLRAARALSLHFPPGKYPTDIVGRLIEDHMKYFPDICGALEYARTIQPDKRQKANDVIGNLGGPATILGRRDSEGDWLLVLKPSRCLFVSYRGGGVWWWGLLSNGTDSAATAANCAGRRSLELHRNPDWCDRWRLPRCKSPIANRYN